MIRVVLDTSVVVSAVITPYGPNAQVLGRAVADKIRPYVTQAVAEEYGGVFKYERLRRLVRLSGRLMSPTHYCAGPAAQ